MQSKWWRLVCFVSTSMMFVNDVFVFADDSSEVPTFCPKAENAIPVKLSQLLGVWHYQVMVTDGPANNDVACSRIEFVPTGNKTAFVSGLQYVKSTGKSSYSYGPVTVLNSEVIRTGSIDIPSTVFYSYPLLVNDSVLIYTTCVVRDNQFGSKNVAVLTRSVTADRKYINNLLSEVNVTNGNFGYPDNYEECFTLSCHRKSG